MTKAAPIVGIDLGTTYSAIAAYQGNDVRFFDNALGQTLTPSVVAVAPRTKLMIVGRTAKDIWVSEPGNAVATFKRAMGTAQTYELGGKRVTPVDLSAYVLDALRADAEQALGQPVSRCVITVPAYFNEAQRFATKQAAETAGFSVERVLNEPTAAAIAYGLHKKDAESKFLVFDLGGGTFDVCVMELFEGLLEVKSTSGESNLGGEDFTAALCDLLLRKADLDPALAALQDREAYALAYKRAELLKRKLSRWSASEATVPAFRGLSDRELAVEVTAEEADDAYAPLLARLRGPCRAALRGAGVRPSDLDEVILAGGATRMPAIRRFVQELFGHEPKAEHDPDLIVARGAAIQAALCADDQAVGDIVVTDVASHSLGVETTRKLGNHHSDGHFTPIIHRGTVIPTSRTEQFETLHPDQTKIDLAIFEGESRFTKDNFELGNVVVTGIPRGSAGQSVLVTFTYDLNGILEVEAEVAATGRKTSRIFKRDGTQLSTSDLRNAESRMRQLKQDPRDRPRFRDVLERANLLWKEVSEQERYALEMTIRGFEEAIATRTPKLMDEAYEMLVAVCERIDGGERW